jgi:hypothetical protein
MLPEGVARPPPSFVCFILCWESAVYIGQISGPITLAQAKSQH